MDHFFLHDDDCSDLRETVEALRRARRRHGRHRIEERRAREEREETLARDIGELALFCHAAIDLLVEKGLLSRDELVSRMREIDAEDGVVDGTFRGPGEPLDSDSS